jgi:hypothetical protein
MRQGSRLTLIPNPRDIPKFVEVLKKRPFHLLPAVNTLFNALLQNEVPAARFFAAVRLPGRRHGRQRGTAQQWQRSPAAP